MKTAKSILLLCLLSLLIIEAKSQGFSYGIKAGYNYSKVSGNTLNANSSSGFHAGAYARLSLIIIALQPELLYSQRGYTTSNSGTDNDVKLNYLEIPIMVKLKVFPMISIDAGPQFSFLLNQETVTTIANNPPTTSSSLANFNSNETAIAVGASLQVLKFGVSARYLVGLKDVSLTSEGKSRMLQLSATFKL